jgi:beta-N-acetylhexosaminidase
MGISDRCKADICISRSIGQTLIMGWDGTEVTPQIRTLIEDHHLGSIILTAKNLKCKSS